MRVERKEVGGLAKSIAQMVSDTNHLQLSEDSEAFAWLASEVASPIVHYLNNLDAIQQDADEAIKRHNIASARRNEIVGALHSSRGVPKGLSKEATANFLAQRIANVLQESRRLEGRLSSSHAELTGLAETVLLKAAWRRER